MKKKIVKKEKSNLPVLHLEKNIILPENDLWTNRFEIKSSSSDNIYIIAQNKKHRHWGCSCPSYRTRRYCKHLTTLGLPEGERPFEVKILTK